MEANETIEYQETDALETAEPKQPPLGLMPRFIADEKRIKAIKDAICRYFNDNHPIPTEWVEEYNILVVRAKRRQAGSN